MCSDFVEMMDSMGAGLETESVLDATDIAVAINTLRSHSPSSSQIPIVPPDSLSGAELEEFVAHTLDLLEENNQINPGDLDE